MGRKSKRATTCCRHCRLRNPLPTTGWPSGKSAWGESFFVAAPTEACNRCLRLLRQRRPVDSSRQVVGAKVFGRPNTCCTPELATGRLARDELLRAGRPIGCSFRFLWPAIRPLVAPAHGRAVAFHQRSANRSNCLLINQTQRRAAHPPARSFLPPDAEIPSQLRPAPAGHLLLASAPSSHSTHRPAT